MSIPAIKAVGISRGAVVAGLPGSRVDDESLPPGLNPTSSVAVWRTSNNAGGVEGGVTNGQDLRITGYMKPIATLMKPLRSVDFFFQAEDGIRDVAVTGVQTCALPI